MNTFISKPRKACPTREQRLERQGVNTPLEKTLGRMRDELQIVVALCPDKEVHKAVKRLNGLVDAVGAALKCPIGEDNCPLQKKGK